MIVTVVPPSVKPDQLPPKMLRWIVNGMRQLDLLELAYVPNPPAATT